jgi:hypothetical protein
MAPKACAHCSSICRAICLGKGKVELQAYYSSQPGWAEQDPEYYWTKLGEACQQVWEQTGIDRAQIAGVSLTTQRGTVINVDAEGKPLRPAILWLDQRQSEVEGGIKGPWAGCSNWLARKPPWIIFALRPRPTGSLAISRKCGRRPTSFCCSRGFSPIVCAGVLSIPWAVASVTCRSTSNA